MIQRRSHVSGNAASASARPSFSDTNVESLEAKGRVKTSMPGPVIEPPLPRLCLWRRQRHLGFWLTVSLLASIGIYIYLTTSTDEFVQLGLKHPNFTFPSPQQRVKYYMGSWYHRDNSLLTSHRVKLICEQVRYWEIGLPQWDVPYLWDRQNLWTYHFGTWRILWNTRGYGLDVLRYIFPYEPSDEYFQMIMMFGDRSISPHYPIVIKSRNATYRQPHNAPLPIIGYLRLQRHFGNIPEVSRMMNMQENSDPYLRASASTPWKQKKEVMFFRGDSTGGRLEVIKRYINFPTDVIDVGFSSLVEGYKLDPKNQQYLRGRVSLKEQLSYKYFLVLEGNDVSSGLKWMLYSDSVVFMARPTIVSWAMEEFLIPFVHYVPLKNDHSDILEMIQWAKKNDDLVRNISRHATQFIEDLFVSPQAKRDNQHIIHQIILRYHRLYSPILRKCHVPIQYDSKFPEIFAQPCC